MRNKFGFQRVMAGATNKPIVGDLVATTTFGTSTTATTVPGTGDKTTIYLWQPAFTMTLDQAWINCTTLLASSSCKVVLYSADASGNPANLLYESATMSTASVAAVSATISPTITVVARTLYYVGVRFSGTQSISGWPYTNVPDLQGGTAFSTAARKSLSRSIPYASSAPATWGYVSSEIGGSNLPAIQFRVAA